MKYHGWPMDAEAVYLDLLGKLSAANARIAELEKAVLACNWLDMGSRAEVSLDEWEALQKLVTAPSQPTTLPESKQQE